MKPLMLRYSLTHSWGTTASRVAAVFFMGSGLLAVAIGVLPTVGQAEADALLLVGLADVVIAAVVWLLPWRRWHALVGLSIPAAGLVMLTFFTLAGLVPPFLYGAFYVLIFVGIGLSFRPWTSLVSAPFAAVAYLTPLVALGESAEVLGSVAVVIPLSVLVGETVAQTVARAREARDDADHRAHALCDSQRRLAEAQRVGRVGSWEWDLRTETIQWSEELGRILGIGPHEDLGSEALVERVHPDDRSMVADRIGEAVASQGDFELEVRVVPPRGTERLVRVRGEVVVDPKGVPSRLVGVMVDVTERRSMERLKAELVGVVSHELRTPLTAIYGALELLRQGDAERLSQEAEELVEMASVNAERLVSLVNDILDLERLESGQIRLEPKAVDVGALVDEVVALMRPQADAVGISLASNADSAKAWVDPDRIFQVLVNLVSNAIKFSEAGTTVSVTTSETTDHVEVAVVDQGRGIPPELQARIFDRFQQVEGADSRAKGGTGLGLAICRTIIAQHGGEISVDSIPDQGATFRFTVPISE